MTKNEGRMDGKQRKALITGITGQDGSFLVELLLDKGYEVHGIVRRSSSFNTGRIDNLYEDSHAPDKQLFLHYGDMNDANGLARLVREVSPHEVYNLASQSHVRVSFDQPIYTGETVAIGTLKLLEAVRDHQATGDQIRYYQASSSEVFGLVEDVPQNEATRFYPRSPYGAAKAYAHWITVNYRESYDLHASCGILFNHESPRRGETFVTRKITRAVGRIKCGLQSKLYLGNLDPQRDWGYAGDYVQAMWAMLQQDEPDDYVIATNECHSVREFCERAFARVDLDYLQFVETDPRYFRPVEVDVLRGDASKALRKLGWVPNVGFEELIGLMVDADLELARRERTLVDAGHGTILPAGLA
jgi:GDPmannose 4,6-dehydratase